MVSPRGSCAWYEARRGSAWLESVTALSKQNRYILRQNKRRFRACASSRYQALISCPLAPGYEAICYCNSYLHEIWSGQCYIILLSVCQVEMKYKRYSYRCSATNVITFDATFAAPGF